MPEELDSFEVVFTAEPIELGPLEVELLRSAVSASEPPTPDDDEACAARRAA
jgi:hypothetical protein